MPYHGQTGRVEYYTYSTTCPCLARRLCWDRRLIRLGLCTVCTREPWPFSCAKAICGWEANKLSKSNVPMHTSDWMDSSTLSGVEYFAS